MIVRERRPSKGCKTEESAEKDVMMNEKNPSSNPAQQP